MAKIGGLNLSTVAGRDGGDQVGEEQPPLKEGELVVVFQAFHVKEAGVEAELGQGFRWEQPLIAEVVNGHHGAGSGVKGISRPFTAQQYRNQARLPVVEVQHVGAKVELWQGFKHGPAKETEALGVVGVVAGSCAI